MWDGGHEEDRDDGHHPPRNAERIGDEKSKRGGGHETNHHPVIRSGRKKHRADAFERAHGPEGEIGLRIKSIGSKP